MGLAHLDTGRAARELLTLFQHQWKTGKVPHIVFDPQAPPDSYFPGAEHWACAAASPEAPPAPPYTINSRSYWRGPVWPVIDWLLWWAFVRAGEHQLAEDVRESSLEQIAEGGFAEYFEPFTGEPLGSREQSWTAAVALDWLAHGPRREMRAA
jgi:Alkaline and neutral invertase